MKMKRGELVLELLVDALIALLEECETGLLGIGHGEGRVDLRGVGLGDEFPDGGLAERALLERLARDGAIELEALRAAAAALLSLDGLVLVDWHREPAA